jgi:hypothetical protein
METKRMIKRINETKTWIFETLNEIEKPLTKLTKRKRGKTEINEIIDKKDNPADTTEIQKILRSFILKNLYSSKLENIKEINTFLDVYDLPN